MAFVQQLCLYISITSFIFLLIGIYKPWVMLWWEDIQNRRKVFKIYGIIAVVSFALYWVIGLLI